MAVLYIQKECLLILFYGLHLVYCAHPVDHKVIYAGQTEVLEGDSLEISCVMSERDLHEWTINSSYIIDEDNDKGYALLAKPAKTFYDKYVLEIQSAQLYHEGEYRCNKYSRDFHYLNVIPISSDDLEEDGKEEEPIVKRSNEHILKVNETIEFYCASARDDNSQVTWYKNSRRILENSDSNVIISGLNLIIQDAQEDDAGEYMCTVDTPYVTGYMDIGRIFRLNTPANILHFPEKMSVIQGRTLKLNCKAQGFPQPKIIWYIGNIMASHLKESDIRITIYSLADGGQGNSFLAIRDVCDEDSSLYTCRAENSIDSGLSVVYDEESVFVHVRAVSSIDFTTSTTYVQKGGKFILACRVAGIGIHLWYKDGKPVVPNSVNKFHLEQDSLTYSPEELDFFTTMRLIVEDADSIHTGEYKCNSNGVYHQNVIVVTENMIEPNEDEPGMGKLLIPGEPLVLQCNTSECPHCTVVWFKDDKLLEPIPGHLEIYEKNNSVRIEQSSYNDSGVYVCAIDRKQLDVALNATIVVQSKIKLEKFEQSSVVVQGSPLELYCLAKGGPMPHIKWFIGDEEVDDDNERVKLLDHEGLKKGKLMIEEADFQDRNYYTCEAYNQIDSVNATIFIRIKDKLAALWPFLGICAEVAILCSIIFVYERRKSMTQCDEPDTDLPTDNKHHRDQKIKGQDVRQRK